MTGSRSAEQILERLERLYGIGGGKGANRPGLSAAEDAAHELASGWMEEAGLAVERDAWGNLFGRLAGSDPAAGELWTGSHLDSVPAGGRFDGALGVVAGLEAVNRLQAPGRTVAVVAFRDEEGSSYAPGCLGSRARCGLVERGELEALGLAPQTAGGGLPAVFCGGSHRTGPGSRARRRSARHCDLDRRPGPWDGRVRRCSASCRDDAYGRTRGRTLLSG